MARKYASLLFVHVKRNNKCISVYYEFFPNARYSYKKYGEFRKVVFFSSHVGFDNKVRAIYLFSKWIMKELKHICQTSLIKRMFYTDPYVAA